VRIERERERGLDSGEGHVRRCGEDKGVHGVVSVVAQAGMVGGADRLYPTAGHGVEREREKEKERKVTWDQRRHGIRH
jgi:hypothetical protein